MFELTEATLHISVQDYYREKVREDVIFFPSGLIEECGIDEVEVVYIPPVLNPGVCPNCEKQFDEDKVVNLFDRSDSFALYCPDCFMKFGG